MLLMNKITLNMKTYLAYTFSFLVGLSLTLSGCNDFLEEEPRNFLSPDQFYQTPSQATSAIIGVYDVLDNPDMYGQQGFISAGDGASDNLLGGVSTMVNKSQNPLTYEMDAGNTRILDFYEASYQLINRANAVVDRLAESPVDDEIKQDITAEAKFLRALAYFNIVQMFGDVILRTEEAASLDNLDQPRSPASDVYAQIIQDLQAASSDLPNEPLGVGRADAWAARALLAKVYLTAEQPNEAAQLTGEIINSGEFSLVSEYNRLFRPENSGLTEEIIFAVQYGPQRRNILTDFLTVAETSAYGAFEPIDNLFTNDLYEESDLRREYTVFDSIVWQGEWLVPAVGLSFLKFAEEHYIDGIPEGQSGTMNFPVLRYADVLLVQAEALARANGNPTTEAYDALNQVRARAGLSEVSGLSQEEFLDLLLRERRLEFVLEGHRWFDLKRFGKLDEKMQVFEGWQSHFQLFPIPEAAITANPLLTQNDNY